MGELTRLTRLDPQRGLLDHEMELNVYGRLANGTTCLPLPLHYVPHQHRMIDMTATTQRTRRCATLSILGSIFHAPRSHHPAFDRVPVSLACSILLSSICLLQARGQWRLSRCKPRISLNQIGIRHSPTSDG